MKLKEFLLNNNSNVKVGASSGFFYCGIAKELDDDLLDYLNVTFKKYFKDKKKELDDYLKHFEEIWEKDLRLRYSQLELVAKMENRNVTKAEIEKCKEEWLEDKKVRSKKQRELVGLTKYLENWENIANREIIETYKSIDANEPEGTIICIVKGMEKGNYWTTNEYNRVRGTL